MAVSRAQVLRYGLRCRCPNCGGRTLFREGSRFRVNPSCSACGLKFEVGEGAFLGPFVINYSVTVFGALPPVAFLFLTGRIGATATIASAAAVAVLLPLLLYRASWGWWVTLYYFVFTRNLPGNLGDAERDDE